MTFDDLQKETRRLLETYAKPILSNKDFEELETLCTQNLRHVIKLLDDINLLPFADCMHLKMFALIVEDITTTIAQSVVGSIDQVAYLASPSNYKN